MTLDEAKQRIEALAERASHDDVDGSERAERAYRDALAILEQVDLWSGVNLPAYTPRITGKIR